MSDFLDVSTLSRIFSKILLIIGLLPAFAGCNVAGLGEISYTEVKNPDSALEIDFSDPSQTVERLKIRHTTPQPVPSKEFPPTASKTLQASTAAAPIQPQVPEESLPSVTPTPTKLLDPEICSPLEYVALDDLPHVVSDGYHPPPMGKDDRHQGVDFAYYHWYGDTPIDGTRIQSVLPGIVVASIQDSFPFGNLVIVETPKEMLSLAMISVFNVGEEESLYLMYAHMNEASPIVKFGSEVKHCETLGYIGRSGNTDASHLHLETRVGPMNWRFEVFSAFRETDTMEQKQNYRLWRTSGLFVHFDPMRLLTWKISHGATATPTASRKDRSFLLNEITQY